MFSGIVQAIGTISRLVRHEQDLTLTCEAVPTFLSSVSVGHSIAMNGACLTVTDFTKNTFTVDISAETLSKTCFLDCKPQDKVNLEKALTLQTLLHGHLVMGHVDAVGQVISRTASGRSAVFKVTIPAHLMRYMAEKGSVCLDGVSLTINALTKDSIMVNCIPQTLTETTLISWQAGCKIHIEVDVIARYTQRLLTS